jgi:BirA family transcriptional regulator, biotin operon repressor / biotin---[acetyl-CoA-carboxylase] ligase
VYDLTALDTRLAGTIFAGKLHFSAVTRSTNTDAMAAGRNGAPHGSVYFADEQTAGRGRGDHSWHSVAGEGLYVSVLLRPVMATENLPMVPLAAGLAAAQAVRLVAGVDVDLRWPNDLMIGERKAGGLLVESKTEAGAPAFVVIGIGINVHQREFDSGLSTPATSIDLASGRLIGRQSLLIALLESLQQETARLHDPAVVSAIPARVAQISTWLWNRRVEVHGPQACVGTTAGLDQNGFLRMRTNRGIVTVQTGGIRAANGMKDDNAARS